MLGVINSILNKVFVREFYRLNAGFFLVVGGLAFGFMSGIEHAALAQFFMSTAATSLIPVVLWFLYAWKVVIFNRQVIKKRGNEFLRGFLLLPSGTQGQAAIIVFFVQLLPAVIYGIFLVGMAVRIHQLISAVVVLSGLVFICVVGAVWLWYGLNHPQEERKVTRLKRMLDRTFTKQYPQFVIGWMVRKSFAMLMVTKVFTCLLIVATFHLYAEEYDWRLLGMGLTVVFASHCVLIFQYHRFENFHFQLLRSLPWSTVRRMINFVLTLSLTALPEVLVLIGKFPAHLDMFDLVVSILYGMSIWILIYGFLYRRDIGLEQLIQRVFVFSLCYVVLVLFSVPPLVLIVVNVVAGNLMLYQHYYTFEFDASAESEK